MSIADEARAEKMCPACTAYVAHYPVMADEWECEHTGDEQAFMLALADAIHGPDPQGEFVDAGWRAAQFLDDAEVALDCGHAPYVMRITHNVEPWSFLALVNGRYLIGTRNDEGAELESVANIGWLGIASRKPEAAPPDTDDGVWTCGHCGGGSVNHDALTGNTHAYESIWKPSQPVRVEVTTVEELDLLPVGSVVRCDDDEGIGLNVAERLAAGWVHVDSSLAFTSGQMSDGLPFLVLYRPAALGGGDHAE